MKQINHFIKLLHNLLSEKQIFIYENFSTRDECLTGCCLLHIMIITLILGGFKCFLREILSACL